MSWKLTTSGAAVARAGTHASTSATTSGALLALFSNDAEGFICRQTNFDWIGSYPTNTSIQNALSDTCSSLIAMDIISWNPTGYLTREADMLMNKNDDRIKQGLKELREFKDTLR